MTWPDKSKVGCIERMRETFENESRLVHGGRRLIGLSK